jgi:hypothetical protein
MPNGFDSPDGLISELQSLAAEVDPADAIAFGVECRDDLASYREERDLIARRGRDLSERMRDRREPTIVVPEIYQSVAEFFVVFDTFVRFFIHPIIVTTGIASLLAESGGEQRVDRIAFRRFGEREEEETSVEQFSTLSDDAGELIEIANELGRSLFGDRFRASDFWRV